VRLKYLSIIRFWTDFTALVAEKEGKQQNFLFYCSDIASKIDKDDNENESKDDKVISKQDEIKFMTDISFINMVLVFYESGGNKLIIPPINAKTTAHDAAESDSESKKLDDSEDDNDIIEHDAINLDDRTVKFLSSFFTIILEMDFKRLSIVAECFQMP
jgi:hypothetical protein